MNNNDIARVCHQVNKDYCEAMGDFSQVNWEDAPLWQRGSAIAGVEFHVDNPEAKASHSHRNWYLQKEADGWVYGEVKDEKAKTHPCMVKFKELPKEQQAKDYIFRSIVHNLK